MTLIEISEFFSKNKDMLTILIPQTIIVSGWAISQSNTVKRDYRNLIFKERLRWMDQVRDIYSQYINSLYTILNFNQEGEKTEETVQISEAKVKMELMLNPSGKEDKRILTVLEFVFEELSKTATSKSDKMLKNTKIKNNRIILDVLISNYLKVEWERAKKELEGIDWFCRKKRKISKLAEGFKKQINVEIIGEFDKAVEEDFKNEMIDEKARDDFKEYINKLKKMFE